jgi:formylglycine-generating enzyme required for sulfatase activity
VAAEHVVKPAGAPAPSPAVSHVRAECPEDMAAVASFCVDRYEAPNAKGQYPLVLQTAYDGEAWCAARGRRLCTEDEWVRACEGASGRRFPYGETHLSGACNDDRHWVPVQWKALAQWPAPEAIEEAKRLYQADPSGSRAQCVSAEGVYDLTGNVAEWVRRSDPAPRPGYDHVLKGCYWAGCYHEPQPNCAFANHAHPGSFRTYEAGFRCCADRITQ